ncbi:MAG: beta-lactamase family protein [Rickettsia endosymbiont of Bryobia graminum]|nr:beta-lactamase family protein [Rickettsia endosymbiont of Bryobia graminum]
MKFYTFLFILLYSSIGFANNLQEVVEKTAKDYLSNRFLNATFIFADSKANLVIGAKGVFSSYGEQLRANQAMPIASSTKPIIATAILRLQDKGLLNVNDKIVKYIDKEYWRDGLIPDFAYDISIHNLLTHTSDLPEYLGHVKTDLTMTQKAINKRILKFVSSNARELDIGRRYNYSNSNFIILGMIIEKVSKKDLGKFLQDEFFTPLKMKSTYLASFEEAKEMQKNSNTSNYPLRYYVQPNNGGKPIFTLVQTEFPLIPYADGGVVSNSFDLIKFYKALHERKILSEKSYKLMTTKHYLVHLKDGKSNGAAVLNNFSNINDVIFKLNQKLHKTYTGYGIFIAELNNRDLMIHHPGGSKGFGERCEVGYIPSKDFYFAILSNVSIRIPNEIRAKIDMNNIANQLDVSYFREDIINSIINIKNK